MWRMLVDGKMETKECQEKPEERLGAASHLKLFTWMLLNYALLFVLLLLQKIILEYIHIDPVVRFSTVMIFAFNFPAEFGI